MYRPRPPHPDQGTCLDLTIENIAFGGRGVGRRAKDGFVVLVPYTAPGDQCTVRLTEIAKRYAFAELVTLHQASPDRVDYPCPWYTQCGGCNLGHLRHDRQIGIKQAHICRELQVDSVPFATDRQLGYRNKASFQVSGRRLGFFSRNSHELIEIQSCLISEPRIDALVPELRRMVGASSMPVQKITVQLGNPPTHSLVTVSLSAASPIDQELQSFADRLASDGGRCLVTVNPRPHRAGKLIFGQPDARLPIALCGLDLLIGADTFFQVNFSMAERLFQAIEREVAADQADCVLELYGGVGVIALLAARKARQVYSVEVVRSATLLAQEHAQRNKVDNVEFRTGLSLTIAHKLRQEGFKPDTLIVDPPRTGFEPGLVEELAHLPIQKIIYVSCSLPTFKRDMQQLAAHGFTLSSVKAFDMFPQTYHYELLAVLKRA